MYHLTNLAKPTCKLPTNYLFDKILPMESMVDLENTEMRANKLLKVQYSSYNSIYI